MKLEQAKAECERFINFWQGELRKVEEKIKKQEPKVGGRYTSSCGKFAFVVVEHDGMLYRAFYKTPNGDLGKLYPMFLSGYTKIED